jgi:hypothetical protein
MEKDLLRLIPIVVSTFCLMERYIVDNSLGTFPSTVEHRPTYQKNLLTNNLNKRKLCAAKQFAEPEDFCPDPNPALYDFCTNFTQKKISVKQLPMTFFVIW